MKEQNKQILQRLYAFDRNEVLKAFELFKNPKKLKKELISKGWYPVKQKPAGREFYNFGGEIWVQTEEARQEYIKSVVEENKNKQSEVPRPQAKIPECPACGAHAFVPVLNPDGLIIYGCKVCRFSKILS